ncbi:isovaleryl-CoA dehydrogenase [Patulibacter medicamentivorans]|uniref:Isovaleryl-CoA dehydrogenase n=1 Tax=Patulibacter medicamentivorans TaxID=1097667 RepID=H0E702_9ACTN|nr:acyl-CoA dehydrogenase family protein [Patulibacter medicamentivorans]EHN10544.1 isovaleryl-CoA dehydrogenase [Patulibacter medicamentivorans]
MSTLTANAGRGLTADQREIFATVDAFARDALHPLQQRMDDEEWWPPEVFPRLGEQGFLGVAVPTELGGVGADFVTECLVVQAISRWNPAIGLSYAAHENLCLDNVVANGSDAVRRRYAPGLCDGSLVGALGLTEPGAGSDALGGMRTTAVRDGDDYVLNGTKLFITNGTIADVVLTYAKTSPEAGPRGISAFVVETGTPGFRVAQKLVKMGLRGSQTAELVYEDVRVPAGNLLGEEDRGVAVVMNGLDRERVVIAFNALGIAERALDLSVSYAREREQFGRPIGANQLISGQVADMYTELEALRSLALDVAFEVQETPHGTAAQQVATRSAALVLLAGRTLNRITDRGVQIHGGGGYIWETEINRLYRTAKLYEIGAGTNEVRQSIVGSNLLGIKAR